jgi:lambda family phage portal protein
MKEINASPVVAKKESTEKRDTPFKRSFIDSIAAVVSPSWHLSRVSARHQARAFEAVQISRTRKKRGDNLSGDRGTGFASADLRRLARELEQNSDVAKGIIGTITNNVVGTGLRCSPQVRDMKGELLDDVNDAITVLFDDWQKEPEVTGTFHWAGLQRMACNTWTRDGETFLQHLIGNVRNLSHFSTVPYSIELLEADLIPNGLNDANKRISYGIQKNNWGRPTHYHVLKNHPGGDLFNVSSNSFIFATIDNTKKVAADKILHLFSPERYRQSRGISKFASVYTRLDDLRDFEEAERIAARIAASQVMAIKKGNLGLKTNDETGEREFPISPGAIWDNLGPDEEPIILSSDRPNNEVERWRRTQLKSVAAGTGANYATIAREYEGSFSSMRQSLVDAWMEYMAIRDFFTWRFCNPIYNRFIRAAYSSLTVKLPANVDRTTLFDCIWTGDPMPWVDPQKEWKGVETSLSIQAKSPQQIIRERGGDPKRVLEEISKWQKNKEKLGIKDPVPFGGAANGQDSDGDGVPRSEPIIMEADDGHRYVLTNDGWDVLD